MSALLVFLLGILFVSGCRTSGWGIFSPERGAEIAGTPVVSAPAVQNLVIPVDVPKNASVRLFLPDSPNTPTPRQLR